MDFFAKWEIDGLMLLQLMTSLFVAILFIQSGLDKVINYEAEKSFYQKHFSKTFLKKTVFALMPAITLAELLAGFLSGLGFILLLLSGSTKVAFWGMLAASLSICMLFFGQRVAKDYQGAAVLVPYFILTLLGLYLYVT